MILLYMFIFYFIYSILFTYLQSRRIQEGEGVNWLLSLTQKKIKLQKNYQIRNTQQKKIQMLFSFKQFEQTKHALITQFERQPVFEIKDCNSSIAHQYNKLLNHIKFAKKARSNTNRTHLQSAKFFRNSRNFLQSDTYRGCSKVSQDLCPQQMQELKNKSINKEFSQQRKAVEEANQQFYITEIKGEPPINEKQQSEKGIKKISALMSQSTEKQQQIVDSQIEDENFQQLMDLRIKIFEVLDQQKYLNTQISDLEQSVRYFKRLNNQLQQKVQQKQKKNLIELNSMLKKQSDLNTVDSRNKYFKEKCEATQKFFAKSLKSIKLSRNSESKICSQMVEDVTQRILMLKYLKQKIEQQKQEMARIQQKNRHRMNRIQQSKNMEKYEEILIKLGQITVFIKDNSYGKIQKLEELQKQMDVGEKNQLNYTRMKESTRKRRNSRDGCTTKRQLKIFGTSQQTNFLHVTKQILKIYLKLTKDEERLKQTYEHKINQLENNRANFCQCSGVKQCPSKPNQWRNKSKIVQLSVFSKEFKQQMKLFDKQSLNQSVRQTTNRILIDPVLMEQTLKKQEQRIKKINQTLLSMEDRSKFFVKKLIKYLDNIMERWLKFDKSAINFLMEIVNKYIKIEHKNKQELPFSQSKDILKEFFQNWENYIFFIEQLYNNAITVDYITKQKLKQMFKKIIKTKLYYQNVSTSNIFSKSIKSLYQERICKIMENIKMFIRLNLDIFSYANKYQVLIVNSSNINHNCIFQSKEESSPASNQANAQNIQANPMMKMLTNLLMDKSGQANNHSKGEESKINGTHEKYWIGASKQDEGEQRRGKQVQQQSSQNDEQVFEQKLKGKLSQKQKQHQLTLVSMILAYQLELNKISKIRPSCNFTF